MSLLFSAMERLERLAGLEVAEGVASAFAATRDGIDTMLRDRGLRATAPDLTGESLMRGAHASGVLDGSVSTLEEVRSGEGDAVAQAALRLSVELLGLAPVFGRSPAQALARLHTVAGAGALPHDLLGRPRDAAAAARLRCALAVLESKRPALVTAALLHAELVVAAPFASANGLVARGAERLLLVSSGVDPTSLVVPEAGHLALRTAYESHLRRYAEGGRAGALAWLLHCAEAYSAGAEASPLRD
jgi:hypothetical protein